MIVVPGKAMLCGEYAVLAGAPAIVGAVGRHAEAMLSTGNTHARVSPLVKEAIAVTHAHLQAQGLSIDNLAIPTIDSRALEHTGGVKLGLGSSAAAATGSVAALLDAAGLDIEEPITKQTLFALSLETHRRAQRQIQVTAEKAAGVTGMSAATCPLGARHGSGSDVAACVFGGLSRVEPRPEHAVPVVTPVAWPQGLSVRLLWTGEAASTIDFLESADRRPELVTSSRLMSLAAAFAKAFGQGEAAVCIALAEQYGQALEELGQAMNVPIVTAAHARLRRLARTLGGAAKPSGAGGGDICVAFFLDEEAATTFCKRAHAFGFVDVGANWDWQGTRREDRV